VKVNPETSHTDTDPTELLEAKAYLNCCSLVFIGSRAVRVATSNKTIAQTTFNFCGNTINNIHFDENDGQTIVIENDYQLLIRIVLMYKR
tara:strand:+ start:489 stop:758 length:270 start_codon:yes stop_codon:yes gene_type:complete